ncbi:unnamed protein product, partial [Timema podura]|nr:unnamed protein product [Timema podura]
MALPSALTERLFHPLNLQFRPLSLLRRPSHPQPLLSTSHIIRIRLVTRVIHLLHFQWVAITTFLIQTNLQPTHLRPKTHHGPLTFFPTKASRSHMWPAGRANHTSLYLVVTASHHRLYTFDNQSQPVYYSYFGQNQSSTDSLDQGQSSAMYAPIGQSPSPYAPIGQSEPLQYYTHEYHTQPPLVYYDPPMCTNQDTMYIANRMPCVTSYVWGNHPQPTPLHAPEAQNASPYVFGAQDHQDEAQENLSDVPVKLQQSAAPVYQKRSAMFAQGAQTQRPGSLNSALKKIIIKPSPNVYPPTAGTQRSNNKDKSSTLSAANPPEPQPASNQEAPIPPPPSAEVIPPPHGQLFYAVPNYYMPPQTSQVPGAETPQFSHTFVRQNSSAGIAPQVHILPETLMNGAINAASSAINTAKSVINNLRARPPTW